MLSFTSVLHGLTRFLPCCSDAKDVARSTREDNMQTPKPATVNKVVNINITPSSQQVAQDDRQGPAVRKTAGAAQHCPPAPQENSHENRRMPRPRRVRFNKTHSANRDGFTSFTFSPDMGSGKITLLPR
ncbi:hypothetical protein [Martelella alba]|uniref:Uncharacterized protein n=1 Tax=Martelella alba TaxID=2590451 RepID=A0ABY2SN60_9HYPH|nr:hypothetical protein [Martelella alba]TKI07257.1 hypothetical protein FCN80_07490 [Martelella alba]